jgi:hypothetical protein
VRSKSFLFCRPTWLENEPLLPIRISTRANESDRVPPIPHPPISIQSHLPLFSFVEPEQQRVRVQLMCLLDLEGRRLKITPIIEPEDL